MNKIKQHLKNNKVTYVACGVTAVVVAGVTYYVTKDGKLAAKALASTTEYVGDTVVHNAPSISGISWKPTIHNIVEFAEQSTPSKPIALLDVNGNVAAAFRSIGEAARQTETSRSEISRHLAGMVDSVKGLTFKPLEEVAQQAA